MYSLDSRGGAGDHRRGESVPGLGLFMLSDIQSSVILSSITGDQAVSHVDSHDFLLLHQDHIYPSYARTYLILRSSS